MKISIVLIGALFISLSAFAEGGMIFNSATVTGKSKQPVAMYGLDAVFASKKGDKEKSTLDKVLVPFKKVGAKVDEAVKAICDNHKGVTFKFWITGSGGADVYVFSSEVAGGLEVNVDCSKE
ncbi:MAG: hypothetical protein H6621_09955 [Halobacteriovoraceae bacterium]|nr:hypothetical protein [Halobacteriovoraceae bacterium]MCB9095381.1 hypothetical protein [Halobacteriovoraceae bacterium]